MVNTWKSNACTHVFANRQQLAKFELLIFKQSNSSALGSEIKGGVEPSCPPGYATACNINGNILSNLLKRKAPDGYYMYITITHEHWADNLKVTARIMWFAQNWNSRLDHFLSICRLPHARAEL